MAIRTFNCNTDGDFSSAATILRRMCETVNSWVARMMQDEDRAALKYGLAARSDRCSTVLSVMQCVEHECRPRNRGTSGEATVAEVEPSWKFVVAVSVGITGLIA